MAVVYRTTDLGQWGAGKGSNLTPTEVDNNFWTLVQLIAAIELLEPTQIANITVDGNEMTIHMDDATTFGPFTLPTATFNFLEDGWQPNTNLSANDLFVFNNRLYLVRQDHLSDVSFNPDAGNMQGGYYALIMPFPTVISIGFSFPGQPGLGIAGDEYGMQAMWSFRADRQFYLPEDLTGSVGGLYIQADAEIVLPIMRNDTEIGTITIAAASTDATFTMAQDEQFEINDVLRVLRPETLDATAKDLTVTLQGQLGTISGS